MAEIWFQYVTDDEREVELTPTRALLSEAQEDRRKLAEPSKAKLRRVRMKPGRGMAMSHGEAVARSSCDWGRRR